MKKNFFCMTVLVACLMCSPVMAKVVISTASKTGTYYKVGNNLRQFVPDSEVKTSAGSLMNLQRLMSGEAQLAIVQMDAYAYFLTKHPEAEHELEILGKLYQECAYLAVRCNGKVKSDDDLQTIDGATVAVGKKGSGTSVTWDYMMQLEPKFKNARVKFKGGSRALGQLAAENVDAVMWVERPRLDGKVSTVMKNKDLCLTGMNDWDLNDKLPSTGKPVYEFKTVDVAKGFFNDKEFETACLDTIIIARADLDDDILDAVADAILKYKSTLLGKK